MSTIQASSFLYSSSCTDMHSRRKYSTRAAISIPKLGKTKAIAIPELPNGRFVEDMEWRRVYDDPNGEISRRNDATDNPDPLVMAKLYAIMEAVADRVEMHKNVGEQRNNWNSLLLTSINGITLAAATMAGMAGVASASVGVAAPAVAALKVSSTTMYLAATGMLLIMNKIQPSHLAEEQRNAARLFKQLLNEVKTIISRGKPTANDVKAMMEKVLALDKAYPLPLLGVMLEKFPSSVEPAVWWPQQSRRQAKGLGEKKGWNGWNDKLEEEMKQINGVIRKNDKADYLRLGEKALKLNKLLAVSGPLLTSVAAFGSAFVGSPWQGSWAVMLGVVAGALATVVNTFEHGGQVGMVFEMYRGNAGFFKLMEESVEANLAEKDVGKRENGELFEMKVALQLGRSLSELRDLAASASDRRGEIDEFASKLF